VFIVLSIFTSFYAGLNTIFETDLKKLIALSTLSHLGFIGLAFSRGLLYLSFFHLLTHALFKSLLFMCMGDIITNIHHSQDYRFLSSGFSLTKSSFFIISVSLINLLGVPRLSGYFSKDLILETLNFSYASILCVFIIFINVIFTYYYTYKLFRFYFLSSNLIPYRLVNFPFLVHNFLIFFLCFIGVIFGKYFVSVFLYSSIHVVVPRFIKFLPIFLNLSVLSILFLIKKLPTLNSKFLNQYFSGMMFLFQFSMAISSYYFLKLRQILVKTTERGVLDKLFNSSNLTMFSFLANFFYKFFNLNPLNLLLFMFMFIFFILLLVLENNIKNINDCYSFYPLKVFYDCLAEIYV
jgi:NADH-ubiquinone oxidoreductase chain 5